MRSPVANASKARFGRLKKKLTRLNPDLDIEANLDSELEHGENIRQLRTKFPDLITADRGDRDYQGDRQHEEAGEQEQSFRDALQDEYTITNRRLQDMIAKTSPPLSTEETGTLAFLTGGGRSLRAVAIDKSKNARSADDARDYMNHFNRSDINTLDDKPKKYVPLYKLKKTDRKEFLRRQAENRRAYEETGMI